ncbi:MAG: ABC transporter permease [Eubacteriales bacterium]|nr:ABC transporter permease [Eubacteriales bacterium]
MATKSTFLKRVWRAVAKSHILTSVVALLLALLFSSIIILMADYNPLVVYSTMIRGVFKSQYSIAQFLGTSMPLIFAGLSMTIASRVGVFNIGIEGQIIMGAFPAAIVGAYVKGLPPALHMLLCFAVAVAFSGFWALIAAILRNSLHISEVILTIMLNYVAIGLVGFLVNYPFKSGAQAVRTESVLDSVRLQTLVANSRLNTGIFIALGLAVLMWLVLKKTRFGYELRAVGSNPSAAEAAGINQKRYILTAMFISGAIAGIGGACEVLGYSGFYADNMTAGYGFDGIAIAVMGRCNPLGTVLSSFVFGILKVGSATMNLKTGIPSEFVKVIQAMIILFVSTPNIVIYLKKGLSGSHRRLLKTAKAEVNGR